MNIGDIIGEYEVLKHIDSGGMGSVYLVSKDNNQYALKTCITNDPEFINRFKREVRLMKSTINTHVIEVLDENLDIDAPYFVMPLCDSSLSDAIRGGLNDDKKFDYAKEFCMGIKALHDSGVIHRDIKPNNALILAEKIKVSDLGLGKFVNRDSTVLTPTSATLGTPDYMSPEIYINGDGQNADKKSDIYSIGKLLYYMFSNGVNPFYINPSKVKADIYSIINKCTKILPNDRYQDVLEIINALNICQKSRTVIISINDIISAHKIGVNNAEFADKVYNHLLTNQDDLGMLINDLRVLTNDNFQLILRYKEREVSNLIHLLLSTHNNDNNYFIKFEDVDVLVNSTWILMKTTKELQNKQDLLDFAIHISVEYSRWSSMKIVAKMFHCLTEEETKSIAPFITLNKDYINEIKQNTNNTLPELVKIFIR